MQCGKCVVDVRPIHFCEHGISKRVNCTMSSSSSSSNRSFLLAPFDAMTSSSASFETLAAITTSAAAAAVTVAIGYAVAQRQNSRISSKSRHEKNNENTNTNTRGDVDIQSETMSNEKIVENKDDIMSKAMVTFEHPLIALARRENLTPTPAKTANNEIPRQVIQERSYQLHLKNYFILQS